MRIVACFLAILSLICAQQIVAMEEEDQTEPDLSSYIKEFYTALGQQQHPDISEMITEGEMEDLLAAMLTPRGGAWPLFAPWRESYASKERSKGLVNQNECPFCDQWGHPECDDQNHFLMRIKKIALLLNKNGTNPLHFLIIPKKHVKTPDQLPDDERHELFSMAAFCIKKLEKELSVRGYSLFFNLLHRCSGASLPNHLHAQLLTRYKGDELSIAIPLREVLHAHERGDFFSKLKQDTWGEEVKKTYNAFSNALACASKKREQPRKAKQEESCVFCSYNEANSRNKALFLRSYKHCTVMFNPVGSGPGQLFVFLNDHTKSFGNLTVEENNEVADVISDCQKKIRELIAPHGISIGIDYGIAGEHNSYSHEGVVKITPRWDNESSHLVLDSGLKVISKNVDTLLKKFREAFSGGSE